MNFGHYIVRQRIWKNITKNSILARLCRTMPQRGCRLIPIFPSDKQERDNPREFRLFQAWILCGTVSFFFCLPISGRKNPLSGFYGALHLLSCLLLLFPFKFFDFMVQKTMVFHDIPAYRIQHELFIYFLL